MVFHEAEVGSGQADYDLLGLSLFFTVGFEHSVANMTLLSLDALAPHTAMTAGAYMYNLLTVTLGNMLGGVFLVAIPYALIGKKNSISSSDEG
nr:formate/nitrite transporter family protein [Peptoniphilus urinae]